jgi:hypothetical protein
MARHSALSSRAKLFESLTDSLGKEIRQGQLSRELIGFLNQFLAPLGSDDGPWTLTGSSRVIKEISFPLFAIGSGATAPTLVRFGNVFGYAFDIDDDGYLQLEVPSDFDDSTGITIFLRTAINEAYATDNAEVRWQGTYSCVPDDESEAVTDAEHTGTLDSGDINIPAIKRGLQQVTLGTIPATDLALNDVLFILLSRIALVGGNNPTAVPVIIQAGYEYTSNKLGEPI